MMLNGNANNFTPYSFTANNLRLKYCCDLDKDVLSSNFEKRGWTNVNQDEDWNFYWYLKLKLYSTYLYNKSIFF